MNATVNPSLLLNSIAAEHIAKCREILANPGMTAEQTVLTRWWAGQRRIYRAALFMMAGVNYGNTKKEWMELPIKHRAALILTAQAFAENMHGIMSTLKTAKVKAHDVIEQESRKALRVREVA